MVEFHYPGYQFLGPGTDLNKPKRPINKLDEAAKKHDYGYKRYEDAGISNQDIYSRDSLEDTKFIKRIRALPNRSIENYLADALFTAKKYINRALFRETVEDIYRKVKRQRTKSPVKLIQQAVANMPKDSKRKKSVSKSYSKKYGKRRKYSYKRSRRILRRGKHRFRKESLFKKVMKIINPVKTFNNQHFMRFIGTLNRRNYFPLTNTTYSPGDNQYAPLSWSSVSDAITYGLGETPFNNSSSVYYVGQNFKWKISNNSNVQMYAKIYWIKYTCSGSENPLQLIAAYFDNSDLFPNNSSTDAWVQDNTIDTTGGTRANKGWNSPLNYNPFSDKLLLDNLKPRFTVRAGKRMFWNPGQTKFVTYKRKPKRITEVLATYDGANYNKYLKGAVFPIFVYDGDILAGTKDPDNLVGPYTALQSGVNRGDWSYQMTTNFRVFTKIQTTNRRYLSANSDSMVYENTAADLKVLGFDNNAPASAI